jgi:hypothetical protein
MTCRQAETLIGVLVLGVIDPEERPAVEAHLATCSRCSATVAELAVLPGLLHRVEAKDAVAGLPPAPPQLREKIIAAGREHLRTQQRRRRAYGLAAAAVVAMLLVGSALFATLRPGSTDEVGAGQPVQSVVENTDPTTGVGATVVLTPKPSGTRLDLTLTGVEPGEHCELVAVSADGTREVTSSWEASYEGEATVTGWTSLPKASITSFDVVTTDGEHLVSVAVQPSG